MDDIKEKFVDDIKEIILPAVGAGVGISYPAVGAIISVIDECGKKADDYRLYYLLNALGEGLNIETLKNQLVNYIKSNDARALKVIDVFRKSLVHESIIAITLMGLLMGENVNSDKDFSHNELLVYKALDNATDYDLKVFRNLIKSKKIKNDSNLSEEEILTCRWCVQNRLFEEHLMEWNIKERYTSTKASDVLYKLMNDVPNYLWNN